MDDPVEDDPVKIGAAIGIGSLGAAALIFAIVKLVQLPITIMTFALGVIQFLVTILAVIALLVGMALGALIIVKALGKAFNVLSAQLRELLEWVTEVATELKKIEAILPIFLTCIAELAVFTLGSEFEAGDKGLLAVYVLAVISMIHLSFGEKRNRLVGRIGLAVITTLLVVYGAVFRKDIYAKYKNVFQSLEFRDQLALLLVLTMILLVFLVASLSWREAHEATPSQRSRGFVR